MNVLLCLHRDSALNRRTVPERRGEMVFESPSNTHTLPNERRHFPVCWSMSMCVCVTALQVHATCRSLADRNTSLSKETKSKKKEKDIPAGWVAEGSWSCLSTALFLSARLSLLPLAARSPFLESSSPISAYTAPAKFTPPAQLIMCKFRNVKKASKQGRYLLKGWQMEVWKLWQTQFNDAYLLLVDVRCSRTKQKRRKS